MSETSNRRNADRDKLPPPTRAQRLAAFGFLGAFGLTILTVILTGLSVGAPAARHVLQPGPPVAETTAPSGHAVPRSGSSSAGQSAPAAAPPSADGPLPDEKPASDEASQDPDNRARKSSHAAASEPQAAHENDGR